MSTEYVKKAYRETRNALKTFAYRILSRSNLDWVTPQLAVGTDLTKPEDLLREGVNAVVNLKAEEEGSGEEIINNGMQYLHIPIEDGDPPDQDQIDTFLQWVTPRLDKGLKVYVHCSAGMGRSPTMVAAYLISQSCTTDEALAIVKEKRKSANPTPRQVDVLRMYELRKGLK